MLMPSGARAMVHSLVDPGIEFVVKPEPAPAAAFCPAPSNRSGRSRRSDPEQPAMSSSTFHRLHRRQFALCAAGVLITAARPARAQTAPDAAVRSFTEVTALLLGLSFDGAQRQRIRHFVDAYWQRRQQREMKAVLGTVDFLANVRKRDAGPREVALRMSRPAALKNLAQEAEAGDALAAWLLAQYHAVHPVLAPARPGGLPLTRDSVDGQLDLAHFMATEVHRQPAHRPPLPSANRPTARHRAPRQPVSGAGSL
jgi:hypothetical protein